MYYDEEPYYEPTPADQIFIEAVNKLEDALKESVKFRVDKFAIDNEKLKQENKKLKDRVNDISRRERDLENEKESYKRQLKRATLTELLEDYETVIYRATYNHVMGEKCSNCDEDRKIHFKSPTNKDVTEDCSCKISKKIYKPETHYMHEFKKTNHSEKLIVWYRRYSDSDNGYTSSDALTSKDFYTDQNFEDIKHYCSLYFKNEEDCKKYCDYLNSKEE